MNNRLPRVIFVENFIPKIAGGSKTEAPIPWQVHITIIKEISGRESHFQCGGTIIDEETILTAAHCFDVNGYGFDFVIVSKAATGNPIFGYQNLKGKNLHNVKETIIHPRYNKTGLLGSNDLAILKLKEPWTFSEKVQAACLPDPSFSPEEGELGVVSGWGRTRGKILFSC